jgi:hypothetical protein
VAIFDPTGNPSARALKQLRLAAEMLSNKPVQLDAPQLSGAMTMFHLFKQ